jgi:hypothetical protein
VEDELESAAVNFPWSLREWGGLQGEFQISNFRFEIVSITEGRRDENYRPFLMNLR